MRALCLVMLAGCGFTKVDAPDLAGADLSSLRSDLGPPGLRVFVTSEKYSGWIDNTIHGVFEADLKCTLLGAGSFRAWISDSTIRATERVLGPGPWVRLDGEVAFAGRPTTPPVMPVNLDEQGRPVEPNAPVWTGTDSGFSSTALAACADWASVDSATTAVFGDADSLSGAWTHSSEKSCNLLAHLYCFEQWN